MTFTVTVDGAHLRGIHAECSTCECPLQASGIGHRNIASACWHACRQSDQGYFIGLAERQGWTKILAQAALTAEMSCGSELVSVLPALNSLFSIPRCCIAFFPNVVTVSAAFYPATSFIFWFLAESLICHRGKYRLIACQTVSPCRPCTGITHATLFNVHWRLSLQFAQQHCTFPFNNST